MDDCIIHGEDRRGTWTWEWKRKVQDFQKFFTPSKVFCSTCGDKNFETSNDMKDQICFWMDKKCVLYEEKRFL